MGTVSVSFTFHPRAHARVRVTSRPVGALTSCSSSRPPGRGLACDREPRLGLRPLSTLPACSSTYRVLSSVDLFISEQTRSREVMRL